MINKKENIINFLSAVFAMALFLFVISSFSDNSVTQNTTSRHELVSEIHQNNVNAVNVDPLQFPSYKKTGVPLLRIFFNENHQTVADNRKIVQTIIFRQRNQLLIKPLSICRFYYHLFSKNAKDLPVLS
jgi:hypothetical protein